MNQEDFITYEYSIQGKVITVTPSEAVLLADERFLEIFSHTYYLQVV